MNESILYYGAMAMGVVVLIWIGTARDRRTHAVMRSFAARNGLNYRPQQLLKGIAAETSGPYQGWSIVIGSFLVPRYQKGIGPAPKESQLEARLELPEAWTRIRLNCERCSSRKEWAFRMGGCGLVFRKPT